MSLFRITIIDGMGQIVSDIEQTDNPFINWQGHSLPCGMFGPVLKVERLAQADSWNMHDTFNSLTQQKEQG